MSTFRSDDGEPDPPKKTPATAKRAAAKAKKAVDRKMTPRAPLMAKNVKQLAGRSSCKTSQVRTGGMITFGLVFILL